MTGQIGDSLVGTLPRFGRASSRGDDSQPFSELGLAYLRIFGRGGEREHLELARSREAELLVERDGRRVLDDHLEHDLSSARFAGLVEQHAGK